MTKETSVVIDALKNPYYQESEDKEDQRRFALVVAKYRKKIFVKDEDVKDALIAASRLIQRREEYVADLELQSWGKRKEELQERSDESSETGGYYKA